MKIKKILILLTFQTSLLAMDFATYKECIQVGKALLQLSENDFIDFHSLIASNLFEFIVNQTNCAKCFHPYSPLMYAVSKNNLKLVNAILEAKVNVNWQDQHGFTALSTAVYLNNKEAVKLLLFHGADSEIVNIQGKKALDFVKDEEIKELLESCFV